MPTPELEDALKAAKHGSAERDIVEVVARALEIPENAVERVMYAVSVASDYTIGQAAISDGVMQDHLAGENLPGDLKKAIRVAVYGGLSRAVVRWCIETDRQMLCPVDKLITDVTEVCSGCPISLDCVANDLSTPLRCYTQGPPTGVRYRARTSDDVELFRLTDGGALVKPLKIVGDTVTVSCEHPKGTYTIRAGDLFV